MPTQHPFFIFICNMLRPLILFFLLIPLFALAQQPPAVQWTAKAERIADTAYRLTLTTTVPQGWELYAPEAVLIDVPAGAVVPADSVAAVRLEQTAGARQTKQSSLFNSSLPFMQGPVTWQFLLSFPSGAPALFAGKINFHLGRGNEFYPLEQELAVQLQGGKSNSSRIIIPAINLSNPVRSCGDEETTGKSLGSLFLLGMLGGFIALLTPCVFPLIPLTVSFFTKRSGSRAKGLQNAAFYGASIFVIYALLSVPFYLLDSVNPEILNNISTNVWLNLIFFVLFIVFALSFFGLFEIGLPASFANKVDAKSGVGNLGGIFFMALTLAIVSFSCTGPILGSLLAGALTNNGGAVQLTAGMSGFGLGLALPFALFALFPHWLQSLPKSGGWLTTVKVVLGFVELALAIKFLSNADLVKQWGLLKREVFIGLWVVIGAATTLYLLGIIRFGKGPKPSLTTARKGFALLFGAFTLYLVPGLFNHKAAGLTLISGFPPPVCYSIYQNPVACERTIEPIHNDYEGALAQAKKENKPLLIDFTGWACVNCRRMEEKVWTDAEVARLMKEKFVVVSLYVDERKVLPPAQQNVYTTKAGDQKTIRTVGDLWATFQSENFGAVSQPQYAILGLDERALTKTKAYTPNAGEFKDWLQCGLNAFASGKQ